MLPITSPPMSGLQWICSDELGPKNPFRFIFSNLLNVTNVPEHSYGAKAGLANQQQSTEF